MDKIVDGSVIVNREDVEFAIKYLQKSCGPNMLRVVRNFRASLGAPSIDGVMAERDEAQRQNADNCEILDSYRECYGAVLRSLEGCATMLRYKFEEEPSDEP